jgi:hypothetical protein
MKKELIKLTFIVLFAFLSGLAFSQDAYLLKYNFGKGKSYVQSTQMTQNVVQSMGGQEIKILTEIKANSEFSVENTDADGSASILLSARNVSVHSVAMGKDTTLNYQDLKDKVRMKLSDTGKSLSKEVVDSSNVSSIVNQLVRGKLTFLPGKAVKIGEKWLDTEVDHNKASSGNPFTIDINTETEYTLTGKETVGGKEYLKISFSSSLTMKGKGTQMGMEMFIEGTGKNEGFSWFDPGTSMVVSSDETTEMNMNVAVSGPQNMTIPMTQSIKTVISFEEKK